MEEWMIFQNRSLESDHINLLVIDDVNYLLPRWAIVSIMTGGIYTGLENMARVGLQMILASYMSHNFFVSFCMRAVGKLSICIGNIFAHTFLRVIVSGGITSGTNWLLDLFS